MWVKCDSRCGCAFSIKKLIALDKSCAKEYSVELSLHMSIVSYPGDVILVFSSMINLLPSIDNDRIRLSRFTPNLKKNKTNKNKV